MRGIVLSLVFFLWLNIGFTQTNLWENHIRERLSSDEVKNTTSTYLLRGSVYEILQKNPRLQILKSYGKWDHVVKGDFDGNEGSEFWSISNNWKLNLEENNSNDTYYLITTPYFNEKVLDSFQVLRTYSSRNTYVVKANWTDVEKLLLPNKDVIHITDKVSTPAVESRVIDMNLNPNRVNKIHHYYSELDGSSETVSIQENRYNDLDIDLLARNIPTGLESETVDNHATEMATIIAGAGNSFITGGGVARKASITSSNFIDAMPDSDESYADLGINTQNHSYGTPRVSEYGVEARAFDQSAFANRNLLHVFSSGNAGLEVSSEGMYAGIERFANLTGNIKMTKNSLVVGSVDTVGNVPGFVSRGPAYDGRVKPEVVAYSVVGSSNSAALVSGVSVIIQQQYRTDNVGADMPSALAKALLINGADDVGPPGLDFLTGYGNVNAWKSLRALQNSQYQTGTISNGNTDQMVISIPSNATNLKVTLVWTDPPANVGNFKALINDLDLRLNDGASFILPWVLDEGASESLLSKPAERGIDKLNNVEQVSIKNPGTTYTVEVEASATISDQDYYIVWDYDLTDSFEWDYPTGSDNMPYNGESGSYFRWDTSLTGDGELSYSIDGETWTLLDSLVDLEIGHWRWNNPPEISNSIKARMTVGTEAFETEDFTVSKPLSAGVGFSCADSLMLRWESSPNAVDYSVSILGNTSLQQLATTSDTFLIIPNINSVNDTRFSIRPIVTGDKGLMPTPTFDYRFQGVECFVSTFFQTVALDTGIYLNLSLGTTYGIEEIIFERSNINGFEVINVLTDIDREVISVLDSNPNQGYNEHQATLKFINGVELVLSAGSTFYLTEIPLRVFPNPVRAGEPLNVITKTFDDRTPLLELIDHTGAIIHKQEVFGSQDVVPTGGIQSGLYIYRLHADGKVYSGRILIR